MFVIPWKIFTPYGPQGAMASTLRKEQTGIQRVSDHLPPTLDRAWQAPHPASCYSWLNPSIEARPCYASHA